MGGFNIYPLLVYWGVGVVVVTITSRVFGALWRRRETHRWTLGYVLVFALAFPLVVFGYFDLVTWAGLLIYTGLCGAMKTAVEGERDSQAARILRDEEPVTLRLMWRLLRGATDGRATRE